MRRLCLCALTILLILVTIPRAVGAELAAPELGAASYVLMDAQSGKVLTEKNADTRRPMASTTKIMTALVVLETLPTDTVVTVPPEAVGVEGSSIYLYRGERITVQTLLYALMLSSANDAAVALAIATDGSVERFAARMNEKAAALGLADTHFCNPNGLHHEEHYTTARDLARLTAAALENETFRTIVSTVRYTAPQDDTDAVRLFLNHNRLLRTLEGAVGVKTGFTRAAGRCLVSAAEREGLTLIAVTLDDPNDWRDHTALMEWGFASFTAFSPEPAPLTIPVVGGTKNSVALIPCESLTVLLPRDHAAIHCTVEAPRFLYGGFEAGEVRGKLVYRLDGEIIGEVALCTAESAERERETGLISRIIQYIRSIFSR